MTVDEAIKAVIEEAPDTGNGAYARMYAKAAMKAAVMYGTKGLKMQIPYILCNLQGWRGERAREIKKVLKSY